MWGLCLQILFVDQLQISLLYAPSVKKKRKQNKTSVTYMLCWFINEKITQKYSKKEWFYWLKWLHQRAHQETMALPRTGFFRNPMYRSKMFSTLDIGLKTWAKPTFLQVIVAIATKKPFSIAWGLNEEIS